jgi:hypothetical protein
MQNTDALRTLALIGAAGRALHAKKIPKILEFGDSGARWCPARTRREEGDDADQWARDGSETATEMRGPRGSETKRRRGWLNVGCCLWAKAACLRGGQLGCASWVDKQASRPKERRKELFSFFFLYILMNSIFKPVLKTVLNQFKFWIKIRQYNKTNAPACMQQHVPSLMMNFNLMKNYYFSMF